MDYIMSTEARSYRSLIEEPQGVAFLEFLVAFVPLWVFFLGMVQLALISHATLIVKHSADAAARSAVVVLPDDPNEYGGEPKMTIAHNRVSVADVTNVLVRILSLLKSPSVRSIAAAFSDRTFANVGTSRLNTILMAAHIPLMPLAPVNVGHDTNPSIQKSIGGPRKLLSSLYYQPFAVAVTFPGVSGSEVTEPEITVRVTYAYQCTVPIARSLLCESFSDLEAVHDLDKAFLPFAQSFVGGRFKQLQQETTLLIHDAPYEYKPRGS